MIAFDCSHCGAHVPVKDQLAGQMGPCPQCGGAVVFPLSSPEQVDAQWQDTTPPPAATPQPHAPPIEVQVEEDESEVLLPPPHPPVGDADPVLLLAGIEPVEGERRPPLDISGYELLEEIGRGGMGVVYQARQIRLNRVVALKMVLAGLHAGPQELARFRTEAEAVASLHHPNIVQIYDVGEQEGRPFLALEYLEGGSLEDQLDGTPLPAHRAAQLIETLARGVHVAHQHGIVHRDLKPGNILMAADGTPKITDFGLAKRLDSVTAQTQSGAIMGTPSYMAPEQAAGRGIGPAADIYALGAMLYELITGRPPFRAESPLDTVMQVLNEEPVRPRRLHSRVPLDLETICLKCLEKEPYRRYPSARALAEDLRRFQGGEPIRARPVNTFTRVLNWTRRRPAVAGLLAAIAIAVVSLVMGGVALWYNSRLKAALDEAGAARRAQEVARVAEDEQRRRADAAVANNIYFNRIALTEREWRAGHVSRAEQLLEACLPPAGRPDPRHWEWHYLKRLCHAELQTIAAHPQGVGCVVYSPDGKHCATAGWDEMVGVWEVATGRRLHWLRGHSSWVRSVAFSPDGQRLVSAGDDGRLCLWDLGNGSLVKQWTGHSGNARSVAWSSHGQRLASAGADHLVKLWDATTGQLLFSLSGHQKLVESVAFSPNGERLASAGHDGTVRVWDLDHRAELFVIAAHSKPVTCVAYSPDGQRLASASIDRTVRVWSADRGREIVTMLGHMAPVRCVAFSPDSQRLASAGHTVWLWDANTGLDLFTLRGHTRDIYSIAFSPDGQRLTTASEDGTLKVWDGVHHPEFRRLLGHGRPVNALAFSPDGQQLASAGDDGSARIWDLATGRQRHELRTPLKKAAIWVAFSPDGTRLASCCGLDTTVWDVASGKGLFTLPGSGYRAAFSPDGRVLATINYSLDTEGHPRGFVTLWDAASGAKEQQWDSLPVVIGTLTFSPDGQRLATTAGAETQAQAIVVWRVSTGQQETTIWVDTQNLRSVAFTPDSRSVAAPSGGYPTPAEVKFWDLNGGEEALTLRGHEAPVFDLALSSDGLRLATVSADKTLRLWDATTGAELFSLRGERDWGCVAFSSDNRRLAAAGKDGVIFLWDAGARADKER